MTYILLCIAAVGLLLLSGSSDAARDEIVVRVGVPLIVIALFPLLYIWNFFASIPKMHSDAEEAAQDLNQKLQKATEQKSVLTGSIQAVASGLTGHETSGKIFYVLFLRIVNTGTVPTIVVQYEPKIAVGGRNIPVIPVHVENVDFGDVGPLKDLRTPGSESIHVKTEQPIVPGGMASGHLVLAVSDNDARLIVTGTQISVSFSDAYGNRTTIDTVFRQADEPAQYLPSLRR